MARTCDAFHHNGNTHPLRARLLPARWHTWRHPKPGLVGTGEPLFTLRAPSGPCASLDDKGIDFLIAPTHLWQSGPHSELPSSTQTYHVTHHVVRAYHARTTHPPVRTHMARANATIFIQNCYNRRRTQPEPSSSQRRQCRRNAPSFSKSSPHMKRGKKTASQGTNE